MRIVLENRVLAPTLTLLRGMKLTGRDSRARTRLAHLVVSALADLQEAELALAAEYATPGADGKPAINPDGRFTLKDPARAADYAREHEALFAEQTVIEAGTYVGHEKDLTRILENYDQPLTGEEAEAYDALLTALENQPEGENNE